MHVFRDDDAIRFQRLFFRPYVFAFLGLILLLIFLLTRPRKCKNSIWLIFSSLSQVCTLFGSACVVGKDCTVYDVSCLFFLAKVFVMFLNVLLYTFRTFHSCSFAWSKRGRTCFSVLVPTLCRVACLERIMPMFQTLLSKDRYNVRFAGFAERTSWLQFIVLRLD